MNFNSITSITFLVFVNDICIPVSSLTRMICSINIIAKTNSTTAEIDFIFNKIANSGQNFTVSYLSGNYPTQQSQRNSQRLHLHAAELLLRNRWRSMRRRFCLSVLIFSEDLPFITEALKIYGPNISHYSNIFAILPKVNSAEEIVDISKFQRDVAFGKLYSSLTLIQLIHENENGTTNISFQVICPLCPNALEPQSVIATAEIFLNLDAMIDYSYTLQAIHKLYNWKNGHGSIAWLCRVGFRNEIRENDSEYHKRVEYSARWKFDRNSSKNGIILGIFMNLLNFTIKMEPEERISGLEEGNYSGIYLSPGGDLPKFHIYGRNLIHSHNLNEFFLYCRKFAIIPSTSWNFFYSPFDLTIWMLIIITGLLFILLHKGRISYGVDIFWSVLGIRCTSDWEKSKFLSYLLLLMINLNTGYLSVITSKVVIPNKEVDIETPTELFKEGYRFINDNASVIASGFISYYRPDLRRFNIDDTVDSNVIVTVDSCYETHNPICISKWAGLATGLLYLNQKAERILEIPADERGKCHGVKKPFRTYWVAFYSQGPLSPTINHIHQWLISAGIDIFWDNLLQTGSIYDAYRKANHSSKGNGLPPSLNFDTPILLVFKAYLLLVCLCFLTFTAEVFTGIIAKIITFRANRVVPIYYEIIW